MRIGLGSPAHSAPDSAPDSAPAGSGWRAAPRVKVAGRVARRALSPFSWPFHHFPWDRTGQKPQLLTSTGERARKVVKGPGDAAPGGRTSEQADLRAGGKQRLWWHTDHTSQST
jgi:hypothetical protein